MATATSKSSRIKPLSERDANRVEEVAAELFPNDDAVKAAAIVYGRKLVKFANGLRGSKPPVPAALQTPTRNGTRDRCVKIATALDLDLVKVGLAEKPAETKPETETAAPAADAQATNGASEVKPDPKPESTGRGRKAASK